MDPAYFPEAVMERVLGVIREVEPPAKSAQEAVERLQHKEAIKNILVAYTFFQATRQWDESAATFTEDGEKIMTGTLDEHVKGRAAMRAISGAQLSYGDESWGEGASAEQWSEIKYRHMLSTEVIRLAPDNHSAKLVSHVQIVATRGSGTDFERGAHEATYLIDFVNEGDGGWLIDRMVILSDHASNPVLKQ